MPRPRLGNQPMTAAERQAKRRDQFRRMREALEAIQVSRTAKDAREIANAALADMKGESND